MRPVFTSERWHDTDCELRVYDDGRITDGYVDGDTTADNVRDYLESADGCDNLKWVVEYDEHGHFHACRKPR